jgi:transketolase
MHTIKPLDFDMLKKCKEETGCIVTVEEASINGGLGSGVAEYLAENSFGDKFARIGIPDEFALLGPMMEVYKHYGMDPESIAGKIHELIGG